MLRERWRRRIERAAQEGRRDRCYTINGVVEYPARNEKASGLGWPRKSCHLAWHLCPPQGKWTVCVCAWSASITAQTSLARN